MDVWFQYIQDKSRSATDVHLGAGNRHSRVGYIPINQRTGKGHKPAVPWGSPFVVNAAIQDIPASLLILLSVLIGYQFLVRSGSVFEKYWNLTFHFWDCRPFKPTEQRKPIKIGKYTYFYVNLTASQLTIIKTLRASLN